MEESHRMGPAEAGVQLKPEFQIKKAEIETYEAPVISDVDLNRISDLDVEESDLDYLGRFARMGDPRLGDILRVLHDRNISNELPVENETFAYKRNLSESKNLQLEVFKMLAKGSFDPKIPQERGSLEQISKLYVLESRKAEWLEEEYYPEVFGDAVQVAQSEVTQFLIKQLNLHDLPELRDPARAKIRLRDELHYVSSGGSSDSGGRYERLHNKVEIKIPSHYTKADEWRVYLVAVHELLHSVSYIGEQRLGLRDSAETKTNMTELNEAVTEMLTFIIALNHLEAGKTPLDGEKERPIRIPEMSYGGLLIRLKEVLSKIPMQSFTDAMLNEEGLARLKDEFGDVFNDPDALIKFADKLHAVYN